MRVRVGVRRPAVRCPTGMAYARSAAESKRAMLYGAHPALALYRAYYASAEHRYAGGIIAAVFKIFQPLIQHLCGALYARAGDYSAHNI